MPASSAPCSFTHALTFGGSAYAAGDEVVVLLEWSSGGASHVMWSPPFKIVPAAAASTRPNASARRLWSTEDWNEEVMRYGGSCTKRDLRFSVGAGMLMRGQVRSLAVPQDFPTVGGLEEAPPVATGHRTIYSVKSGTDAQDLFPKALCAGGLCSGLLPGCANETFQKLHIPLIKFDFNREFRYGDEDNDRFRTMLRQALAYAFSVMPEAVDVAIKELNESGRLPGGPSTTTTAVPNSWWGARAAQHAEPPQAPLAAASALGRPTEEPPTTTRGAAYKRWWTWNGAHRRRLEGLATSQGTTFHDIQAHQAILKFRHRPPYNIDRPLVEMMLRNGYFVGVDDDGSREHGALRITGFYMEDAPAVAADAHTEHVPWYSKIGARSPGLLSKVQSGFVLITAAGGAYLAAAVARAHRDLLHRQPEHADEDGHWAES